mgnify:CR=1 FL=1
MQPVAPSSRVRLAELSSSLGAGVLGLGLGALLASQLHGLGVPIIVIGLILHVWGMTDKHRLEHDQARQWWSAALYWICWVALAGLATVLIVRAIA